MTDGPRFTRQVRLPEIGEAGQQRLSAATVTVRSTGDAADVESRYLIGAGVAVSGRASSRPPSSQRAPRSRTALPDLGIVDPAARDVAEGSLRALITLRSVLESS